MKLQNIQLWQKKTRQNLAKLMYDFKSYGMYVDRVYIRNSIW